MLNVWIGPRDMPLEARKVEHIKELIKDGKLAEIDHIFQATPTDINARDKV